MLDGHCLVDVAARLPGEDLRQFLSVSKYLHSLANELCVIKLQNNFDIQPSDYKENPRKLYQRLLNLPKTLINAQNAAASADLPAVKYLVSIGIRPSSMGANLAADRGGLETIQYLASLSPPILPDQEGANCATSNGHLEMVQYLASLGILPNENGANWAAEEGHLDVVQYLAEELTPPILPNQMGANWAAEEGHLKMVNYLVSIVIRPTYEGANWAAGLGKLDMVQYLATLNPPILPNQEGANYAARFERLDVVKFLATLGIYPTSS